MQRLEEIRYVRIYVEKLKLGDSKTHVNIRKLNFLFSITTTFSLGHGPYHMYDAASSGFMLIIHERRLPIQREEGVRS